MENMRTEVLETLKNADTKVIENVYKYLTSDITFDYHDRSRSHKVTVELSNAFGPHWVISGKRHYDGKEFFDSVVGLTVAELCNSKIGQELNLIEEDVIRGLGWDDEGTLWGLPPHARYTIERIAYGWHD